MSSAIKPISKLDIHKICSGQVVLNLATAVKELIENSLDAKSLFVEIKLKEFGKDLIEVIDNGVGVHPDNFEGLGLKHHTSKIQDFSDLSSVETFGFRGEALSSLCALSDVIVITKHSSQICGTKLVFDHQGLIKSQVPYPRQVGTTVTLLNLFSTLPVRHKEFQRNLKKEFGKMIQVITGYCLVATSVKILCSNQSKTLNNILLSTHGRSTVLENISCIFGSKQTSNLLVIKKVIPEEIYVETQHFFEIDGYISNCDHSCGRSSKDRQFYFINSRPCEPLKIIKIVNEIYHQYNQNQYPFVYLNILIERAQVDVNVTPDKRQIFLTNEKYLLTILRASLNKLYESIPSTYKINTSLYESTSLKRIYNETSIENTKTKQPKLDSAFEIDNLERNNSQSSKQMENEPKCILKKFKDFSTATKNISKQTQEVSSSVSEIIDRKIFHSNICGSDTMNYTNTIISYNDKINESIDINNDHDNCITSFNLKNVTSDNSCDLFNIILSEELKTREKTLQTFDCHIKHKNLKKKNECSGNTVIASIHNNLPINHNKSIEIDESNFSKHRRIFAVEININNIKEYFTYFNNKKKKNQNIKTKFFATIDPGKNQQAENELSREITKDMFKQMSIIGQFNLGFIITKLDGDLFIVDQHATDEKYNFEILQLNTKITSQKLFLPQQLDLTSINEMVLMENLNIFRMNGFDFDINENAETTKKIKLTTIPMSKNCQFGKEDVEELIFMLQDAPQTLCRPSRVRSMFASRACRKSVMIGSVLTAKDMRKIIDHMGVIEQPWFCFRWLSQLTSAHTSSAVL
ncbi:mismatch repair endonuclease PMS2 isoform X2 [Daktulosphaira vitifoliae]|uniref:mismatch repair endonuclease PMS2 isoform X2 n=1 Tax=Daktulosphaira vitifoliae TaxID=58002 RepID=UPI0021AA4A7C|nr:mismatch repair endonuclease PMS2 isoform X2 [Daktulosphaira vitifoliae]